MSKPNAQLTAEAILNIIADTKPKSLTGIAHAMGYKGTISGSVAARIRELVPNVTDLLTAKGTKGGDASGVKPVAKEAAKPAAGKKPASVAYPVPECCPFRPTSGYRSPPA